VVAAAGGGADLVAAGGADLVVAAEAESLVLEDMVSKKNVSGEMVRKAWQLETYLMIWLLPHCFEVL
jgi:hypothetical protein